mmetsp:Transcript_22038/g.46323  ORF Transcript_22038/g.46323 Transcript_22038/m.46323 type:complete len:202 (+) Transcript_22038:1675-2280(+)
MHLSRFTSLGSTSTIIGSSRTFCPLTSTMNPDVSITLSPFLLHACTTRPWYSYAPSPTARRGISVPTGSLSKQLASCMNVTLSFPRGRALPNVSKSLTDTAQRVPATTEYSTPLALDVMESDGFMLSISTWDPLASTSAAITSHSGTPCLISPLTLIMILRFPTLVCVHSTLYVPFCRSVTLASLTAILHPPSSLRLLAPS